MEAGPEAQRVFGSPRGAACSRARPRARGKASRGLGRGQTRPSCPQACKGASGAARCSPRGSPAPGAPGRAPHPAQGAGSCPGGAQARGGGAATSLQARACVWASRTRLLPPPPPPPRCTGSQGAPREAVAARSHCREQIPALHSSSSSCSVPGPPGARGFPTFPPRAGQAQPRASPRTLAASTGQGCGDFERAKASSQPPRPPSTARGRGSGEDEGRRPAWPSTPSARPRHEGDGGEGNPSQDIDFIF